MKLYVLSPEVYVDATKSPSGPPAQLFNAYVGMRDEIGFVMTPWIKKEIIAGLLKAGYNEATAKDQADFIESLCFSAEDSVDTYEPLVGVACSLDIDTIYHASGQGDRMESGVVFRPISELLSILVK